MGRGLEAIKEEWARHGTEEDQLCLRYVLHDPAGSNERLWPHAGHRRMDVHYSGVEDGRAGQTLAYFIAHPSAVKAELLPEHVVALRLYTTAAFRSLNDPLRGRGPFAEAASHPFPVTIAYLTDGIKKLRAVSADAEESAAQIDLWRGMRNVALLESFRDDGGTEFAPMSTTRDLRVALSYSDRAEKRLLFKLRTHGFIDRGADLAFLSAFPDEIEVLYPPLTFLLPTGREDTITVGDIEFSVVEVEPRFAS